MRCVSRNETVDKLTHSIKSVAPRMRCVSRNIIVKSIIFYFLVAPRMRCVSRNCEWSVNRNIKSWSHLA